MELDFRTSLIDMADGGMWKLTARQTIKEYLEKALEHEVREGTVVIAL